MYIYEGADLSHQEVLVWDSDPDFIEYRYRTATPEGPSEKKAPKDLKPSRPSTMAKSPTNGTVKAEFSTSGSLVSIAEDSSLSGLPNFVLANWVNRFLPMLYHRFGSSEEPWKLFTKGTEMLSIIQELINVVYPNSKYRVKWGDKIFNAVQIPLFLIKLILILSQFQGEQPLIFQKVHLWQPSGSGCRSIFPRW